MITIFSNNLRFGAMGTGDHSKNGASPKSHTIRGNFILFALVTLSILSCSPYMTFTPDQRELIGKNIENVQLYLDRKVELSAKEFKTNVDTTFEGGKVNTSSLNVDRYRLFEKHLKGRALVKSTQNTVYLWVDDERDDNILVFKNFSNDEYYQLVGNKKSDNNIEFQYGGGTFYLTKGTGCRLLMKKTDKLKEKKEKKKAKGVKYIEYSKE